MIHIVHQATNCQGFLVQTSTKSIQNFANDHSNQSLSCKSLQDHSCMARLSGFETGLLHGCHVAMQECADASRGACYNSRLQDFIEISYLAWAPQKQRHRVMFAWIPQEDLCLQRACLRSARRSMDASRLASSVSRSKPFLTISLVRC